MENNALSGCAYYAGSVIRIDASITKDICKLGTSNFVMQGTNCFRLQFHAANLAPQGYNRYTIDTYPASSGYGRERSVYCRTCFKCYWRSCLLYNYEKDYI